MSLSRFYIFIKSSHSSSHKSTPSSSHCLQMISMPYGVAQTSFLLLPYFICLGSLTFAMFVASLHLNNYLIFPIAPSKGDKSHCVSSAWSLLTGLIYPLSKLVPSKLTNPHPCVISTGNVLEFHLCPFFPPWWTSKTLLPSKASRHILKYFTDALRKWCPLGIIVYKWQCSM